VVHSSPHIFINALYKKIPRSHSIYKPASEKAIKAPFVKFRAEVGGKQTWGDLTCALPLAISTARQISPPHSHVCGGGRMDGTLLKHNINIRPK
jgi:hypothetical protein